MWASSIIDDIKQISIKRYLLSILITFSVLPLCAKSMSDVWLSMPDSIVGYLDKGKRMEFLDYLGMQSKSKVKNSLEGNSAITSLTNNYIKMLLNESSILQIKLLPTESNDSVICLIKTLKCPGAESEIYLYTQTWKKIKDLSFPLDSLMERPDTMSLDNFIRIKGLIDPIMVEANLSEVDNSLQLQLSMPDVSKEDKNEILSILQQRKLNWNGKTFN
jgi:hypothetical protein